MRAPITLPPEIVEELATSEERAPFLVAADWLCEREELLGELMSLSLGVAGLTKHGAARIAALQRALDPIDAHVPHAIDWRFGLIDRLAVYGRPPRLGASARFVRALSIETYVPSTIAALAENELPALRELRIVVRRDEDIEPEPIDGDVFACFPRLELLQLDALVERIAHPTLRELRLQSGSNPIALDLPKLERAVWAAPQPPPPQADPDDNFTITERTITARSLPPSTATLELVSLGGGVAPGTILRAPEGDGPHAIGRDPSSWLVLDDKRVGRRHARIFREVNRWFLADNGDNPSPTRLQGIELSVAPLRDGDEVSFGFATFRARLS